MRYDIVVISGGIIGSSIDYHLAHDGRAGEVAVIERDPSYGEAATPRGSGGIRQCIDHILDQQPDFRRFRIGNGCCHLFQHGMPHAGYLQNCHACTMASQ